MTALAEYVGGQPFRSLGSERILARDHSSLLRHAETLWRITTSLVYGKRLSHARSSRLPWVRSLILQVIGDIQQFLLQPHSSVPERELVILCDQSDLGLCKLSFGSLEFCSYTMLFNKNLHCALALTHARVGNGFYGKQPNILYVRWKVQGLQSMWVVCAGFSSCWRIHSDSILAWRFNGFKLRPSQRCQQQHGRPQCSHCSPFIRNQQRHSVELFRGPHQKGLDWFLH